MAVSRNQYKIVSIGFWKMNHWVAAQDAPFSFLLHRTCAKPARRYVCWHLSPSEDICCLLLTFVGICWVPTQFHLDLAGDSGGALQKGKDFSQSQSSQFSTSSFGIRRLENLNTCTQLPTIFRKYWKYVYWTCDCDNVDSICIDLIKKQLIN